MRHPALVATALGALIGFASASPDASAPDSVPAPPTVNRALLPERTGPFLLTGSIGRSLLILGSEEDLMGVMLGIQYEVPRRKIRFWRADARPVIEAYYQNLTGGTDDGASSGRLITGGILVLARFRSPLEEETAWVTGLGWGLQYGNHATRDLDSRLNSTPVLECGLSMGKPEREVLFMVRFLHASNAGLKGNNQGQNQTYLYVAVRM
ncbi:MAG: acyloxyacyl hydrolase [Fimbriimonadaceae bacterium]